MKYLKPYPLLKESINDILDKAIDKGMDELSPHEKDLLMKYNNINNDFDYKSEVESYLYTEIDKLVMDESTDTKLFFAENGKNIAEYSEDNYVLHLSIKFLNELSSHLGSDYNDELIKAFNDKFNTEINEIELVLD